MFIHCFRCDTAQFHKRIAAHTNAAWHADDTTLLCNRGMCVLDVF